MDIILLENIRNLGALGELVSVKAGYGRNYLVPLNKAMYATDDAKDRIDEARRNLAKQEAERLDVATARAALAAREVAITRLANAEGHLFGSVANTDIAEALTTDDVKIEKSEVYMPDGAFKNVGDYTVEIKLHDDINFNIAVEVIGEESDGSIEGVGEDDNAHPLKGFVLPSEADVGELDDD